MRPLEQTDVLIAGAGIGGLTAALALANIGKRVTILERAPALAAVGAGVQLSPNAARLLRRLGLLPALKAVAMQPTAVVIRSARSGRILCTMPLDDAERRWGAPYLVAKRADLQAVLLAATRADDGITLRLGTVLAGFGTTRKGVEATVKNGLVASTVAATILVGADGVRSSVRARLVDRSADEPTETGRTAWRALVPSSASGRHTTLWLGHNAHLVHYPIDREGTMNVVAVTRDRTTNTDWSAPGNSALLAARFADWHADARRLIGAAPGWSTWPLFDRQPLPSWSAGPVALLGDAAHPILPFLAQGAAQAIEDAVALTDALTAAQTPAGALVAYSNARQMRAARVQAESRRLGRIYHLSGPAAFARDVAMRSLSGERWLARYDWLYGPRTPARVTGQADAG